MLNYPNINPVVLHITDTLQIRWYGLMYLLAFALGWCILRARTQSLPEWDKDKLSDLLFYTALGIILGGRIGYMLFYSLPEWSQDPMQLFKVWQGGMSFHGGLIGVMIAIFFFCRHTKMSILEVGDILVLAIPLGLAAGRIGNFINGELWGKVTDVPWGMVFPHAGSLPRHPSQLYAVFLEGFLLFTLLWLFAKKPRPTGAICGLFFLGYGLIRFSEEFFRQPDPQYGYLAFGWLTMGQVLSLPMIVLGLYLLCCYPRRKAFKIREKELT